MTVSSLPYHGTGASAVQELAFTLATGVEYLRALTEAGLTVSAACEQVELVMGVGRDLFMEVAKLRAARRLWSAMVRACRGSDASQGVPIHAVASPRTVTVLHQGQIFAEGSVAEITAHENVRKIYLGRA